MNQQTHRLRLPGKIDQVRAACDFVATIAEQSGLSDDSIFQTQLAVEEVFTNIVEHGYDHQGADKSIEIVVEISKAIFRISIIDEAPRFNPLNKEDADPNADLWEREDGGWGIYFVRQYMDDVRYRYTDQRNHLILDKKRA